MGNILNIGIAEDHQVMIDGLSALLDEFDDIKVILTAKNGVELLEQLNTTQPDVILMDINMPEMDGIEASRQTKERYPNIAIVILSMFDDVKVIKECLKAGVDGYLLKETGIDELEEAIRSVSKGETHFSKPIAEKILIRKSKEKPRKKTYKPAALAIELTPREKEVLELICEEYTSNEIAAELYISVNTVETHRRNLLDKTKSRNIAGLFRYALQNNLLLQG